MAQAPLHENARKREKTKICTSMLHDHLALRRCQSSGNQTSWVLTSGANFLGTSFERSEKKGGREIPARPCRLEACNVGRLQALWATGHFKCDGLTVIERPVPLSFDGGEMDKNVLAALALDESKTLTPVEPLHCSLFFHYVSFFCLSYLMFPISLQP